MAGKIERRFRLPTPHARPLSHDGMDKKYSPSHSYMHRREMDLGLVRDDFQHFVWNRRIRYRAYGLHERRRQELQGSPRESRSMAPRRNYLLLGPFLLLCLPYDMYYDLRQR